VSVYALSKICTWAPSLILMSLPISLTYFFSNLDRVFAPGYTPTDVDIVHTRARTIGLTETSFALGQRSLLLVDVGGQRSERRKWIHCFQDVTSIIFLVNLSGYDQCLVEDKDANQMVDAMSIWDSVTASPYFKRTPFMLFLNKFDLFKDKVRAVPIRATFPDYEGPAQDPKEGVRYFQTRFIRMAQRSGDKERGLYPHTTTATDRKLLGSVMKIVEE
jgi:guanine nucleotide-binding protein subunit alpha, other